MAFVMGTPAATVGKDENEIERRFRQLTATLTQVFWIIDLMPSMTMPYVSPAFESIWGIPAAALYANPALWDESIVPADRAAYHAAYTRWAENPEAAEGYAVEYRIRRPNGSQRWISGRGRAQRNAAGEVYRLTGFAEDITQRKLAELEAEQGQRHLRELIDGLPQLVWSSSPDGNCDYVNPRWAEFTGRPLAEHLGTGWVDAVHPNDIPDLLQAWRGAIAERQPYDCELRLLRHDGAFRWMTMRAVPLCGEDNRVLRWLGSCTDTHALRQAGDALAEQHHRMLRIANSVPSAIHSYRLAPDGHARFPFGAERVAELYGVPAEALATDATVVLDTMHPEDAPTLFAAVAESARSLTPWFVEFRIRHPVRGELWVEGRSMPTREPDGGLLWHGSLTDITERKRAERALFAGRAQLAAIFEDLSEGLIIARVGEGAPEYNRAALEIHAVPPGQPAPANALEYREMFEVLNLEGEPIPQDDAPLARALRGERVTNCQVRLRHRRDGWEKVMSVGGSLVHGFDGDAFAVVLSFEDITERHRHQAQIERMNHELEQRVALRTAALAAAVEEMESFSYTVSHDLRAPLRGLDGVAQAVLREHGPLLPENGRRYLQIIRNSARKMGQLIDDLLAFSRIGRTELKRHPVDPAMLVRDALGLLAPMREGREVQLVVGDLPACQGDPALLRQVWINLISNALKYSRMRDPARIEIGCERDAASGRNVYFVRDNGSGFDMQYAHKLFGVFERLHRAEEFEGTGVGLAIVQRIVQRHGGSIRAEAAPDQGACFFFDLGD